jgi:NAD(P)-dependent dehydrogenase (short-subunit alcohol dehydrogenase family)
MSTIARSVDAVLEATVVGSFSRVGHSVRSRLWGWPAADRGRDLTGRTVVVTGATSGIGLASAMRFAQLGATVRFLARDGAKAERARTRIEQAAGRDTDVAYDLADMSDLASLRGFAARLAASNPRLDVLVHNAGALSRTFSRAPDGTELTLASHVLGPFLLTGLLLPALRRAAPARVITVSSGGMYTQRLELGDLEMDRDGYDGKVAYARAKRAQVVLNHEWARRVSSSEVVFHAMHPGWVDTPGVVSGLPGFHRAMRPLLRTPEQGADTVVWLASAGEALRSNGSFWLDRRRRSEHRVPWTRGGDDGDALWALCRQRTGWEGP